MNSDNNHLNAGLPSFQSVFHGRDGIYRQIPTEGHAMNIPDMVYSHGMTNHLASESQVAHGMNRYAAAECHGIDAANKPKSSSFYYDSPQSNSALDLSCTEPKHAFKTSSVMTAEPNENSNEQSRYYKECLPSFANFMNFQQIEGNANVDKIHPKTENETYNSCRQNRASTQNNQNYYSQKLNEMSQVWKNPIKTEEHAQPTSDYSPFYSNNMMHHPAYSQYNPYQFLNNAPTTSSSINFPGYNNQQLNSYQQYFMYPEMKSEDFCSKSFQNQQLSMGEDENDFGDLDSMVLKRRKPSSTSKRAKKMRGGVEDCNYELCNMWDEVAAPLVNIGNGKCTKKSDVKDLVKTESSSCDSQNSNDTLSDNYINETKPDIVKPVTIFNFIADETVSTKCRLFVDAERRLCQHLKLISFGEPVSHIYNPLVYAFETHLKFLKTFCTTDKTVLFLAMNPGPFGMSQNGVPFGEVSAVRDWIGIRGNVQKPAREHPKRCITGLDCHRSEVSGSRFWGFFRKVCGTPEVFFKHCFVHNLCPLAFMSPTGRNITPPELRADQRNALNQACDMALVETLNILQTKIIVCIGKFVESRVQSVLKNQGNNEIRVERITHPSPINPAANKGWDDTVYQQLKDIGIMSYFTRVD